MSKLATIALCVLAVYLLLTVCAFQFFGFFGLVGMFVLTILGAIGGKKLLGVALKKAFLLPFKAKGSVLASATAKVNSVSRAPEPVRDSLSDDDDDSDMEPTKNLNWFMMDVTITPKPMKNQSEQCFSMWEPGELCVVPYGVTGDAIMNQEFDDEDACEIAECQIWHGSEFVKDEGMKFEGEVRLRLHVGVAPEVTSVAFQYYFEVFGEAKMSVEPQSSKTMMSTPGTDNMMHH